MIKQELFLPWIHFLVKNFTLLCRYKIETVGCPKKLAYTGYQKNNNKKQTNLFTNCSCSGRIADIPYNCPKELIRTIHSFIDRQKDNIQLHQMAGIIGVSQNCPFMMGAIRQQLILSSIHSSIIASLKKEILGSFFFHFHQGTDIYTKSALPQCQMKEE